MKKIFSYAMIFLLMVSAVLAAGGQGADNALGVQGDNNPVPTLISQQEEVKANIAANRPEDKGNEQLPPTVPSRVQERVQTGEYESNGKTVQIQERANNRVQFQANGIPAETAMQMSREMVGTRTQFKVKLSNGQNSEIKIMPDTASARAMERLQLKVCQPENCQIELKEVRQGEQIRAAYEVQAQKQVKLLGLFKSKMQVQAQIDAENGEVISSKKPWWAVFASNTE